MSRIPATRAELDRNYNTVHVAIPAVTRRGIAEATIRRWEASAEDMEKSADRWAALGEGYSAVAARNLDTARQYRAEAAAVREEMQGIV